MAEISKDTQAILDRLKREGSLTRNGGDGKNSLKSVKINLEKFGVLFQGIQNELANLNKTFGQMLSANPNTFTGPLPQGAQAVAQTTLEPIPVQFDAEQLRALGLDEETIELQKEAAKLNIANNLEDEKLRQVTEAKRKEEEEDKKKKERAAEAKNYLKENTITGQVITNPLSFFTKLLKGAAIAFVGFNVVRGIVDQWTDGKFTKFIEEIDYEAIGDGIKSFASFLGDTPWAAFTTALVAWTAIDFGLPLALNVTGEVIRTSMLAKMLNKGVMTGVESSKGFMSTVTSLRGVALGAVGIGIAVAGQKIADVVRAEISGMTPDQIANEKLTLDAGDAVDVGSGALAGATIGFMFGPQGAIVGAILGFAFGVGKKAYDYIKASSEEKIGFDEMGEDLARTNAKTAQLMLQEHADGKRKLDPEQIEALQEQAKGPSQELLNATNNEIGDQRAKLNKQIDFINMEKGDQVIMGFDTGPDGELVPRYGKKITDASKIAEREADIAARLKEKEDELARVNLLVAERIEKGFGTQEQMTKQVTKGFIEAIKFGLFGTSSDMLEYREEQAEEQRLSLIDYFTRSDEDDYLNDTQVKGMIKLVEDTAMTKGQMINIIKEGDVNQYVDASDKSSTVKNVRTLFPNTNPAPQPNG